MKGCFGRVLNVDLTKKSFEIERIPDAIYEKYLGGKGLATWLLTTRNPKGVDPLSPDNLLIVAAGPLAGSRLWGASRYGVYTKSPQTGIYAESYSGGRVPEAVDAAGYDAVVVSGRAETPLALSIHPDGCAFHEAGDLWGMETYQAEDEASARFGAGEYRKRGAIVIGPAGENLVRFSVIENDYWRSAGRTGVGTVMGSKKLKAMVFQGDRKREFADPDGAAAFAKAFHEKNKSYPGVVAYMKRGTTRMVRIMNMAHAFPSKYWSQGTCDHWEKLSGLTLHTEHDVAPKACLRCFMACGRMTTIKSGRHAGLRIEGPEYETIYAFGGLCMIDDIAEIAYLNDICDRLGMDTISAGNLCAFAIEAVKRGKASFPIDYNDPDGTAALLKLIARKEGIGAILAEGIVPAAKAWGLEDLAIHVKGLEPAGYDPRPLKGVSLAYAASDRGACHLRSTMYAPELAGLVDRNEVRGKAEFLLDYEDRLTLFDCMVLCRFYRDMYPWDDLEQIVRLVTGLPKTKDDLKAIAVDIANMTRKFSLREGMRPEQDRIPARLLNEALPTGEKLTREEFDYMLADYYRLRDWDETGRPKSE